MAQKLILAHPVQLSMVGSTFDPQPCDFEKYAFSPDLHKILGTFFDIPKQK